MPSSSSSNSSLVPNLLRIPPIDLAQLRSARYLSAHIPHSFMCHSSTVNRSSRQEQLGQEDSLSLLLWIMEMKGAQCYRKGTQGSTQNWKIER